MPSHRTSAPDLVAGTLGRRRGWVKLTVAGLCAAAVIGSLVAWRVSSAKKEEKKSAGPRNHPGIRARRSDRCGISPVVADAVVFGLAVTGHPVNREVQGV